MRRWWVETVVGVGIMNVASLNSLLWVFVMAMLFNDELGTDGEYLLKGLSMGREPIWVVAWL